MSKNIKEFWDNHPLSFYISSMIGVASVVATILVSYYNNRIDDIKNYHENRIKDMEDKHRTALELVRIKTMQEIQTEQFLKIDRYSTEGKELEKLLTEILKNKKNEK